MAWGQWQLAVLLLQCMRDLRIQKDEISSIVALIALTWFVAQRMPCLDCLQCMPCLRLHNVCVQVTTLSSALSPRCQNKENSSVLQSTIFLHKHLHVPVVVWIWSIMIMIMYASCSAGTGCALSLGWACKLMNAFWLKGEPNWLHQFFFGRRYPHHY